MADQPTPNGKDKSKHTLGATELLESLKRNDFGDYCECMEIYLSKFKEYDSNHQKEPRKRKQPEIVPIDKQNHHDPPV